jgi:hypothetical protein
MASLSALRVAAKYAAQQLAKRVADRYAFETSYKLGLDPQPQEEKLLADPRAYRAVHQAREKAEKALKTGQRLFGQWDRLRADHRADPAKIREVKDKFIILARAQLMGAADTVIEEVKLLERTAKSKKLGVAEHHWVQFAGESAGRAEKELTELKAITANKGLDTITDLDVHFISTHMAKLYGALMHTVAVMANILKA